MTPSGQEIYEEDPKPSEAEEIPSGNEPDEKQRKLVESGYGTPGQREKEKPKDQPAKAKAGLSQELCNAFIEVLRSGKDQALLEDALAEQPDKLKFDAGLRKQLEKCLAKGDEVSEDLKKALSKEIAAGNIRPALSEKLEKLLDGSANPAERALLSVDLTEGLYKENLLESIITDDFKAKRFGSASSAIWKATVEGVEKHATKLASLLVVGNSKYIEADAPFSANDYKAWLAGEKKPEVKLGIDTEKSPDIRALSRLRDTIYWNAGEEAQVSSLERAQEKNELVQLVAKHQRERWLPDRTSNAQERERRFVEIAGILGPAKTAEDTLDALKWITAHREEAENLPWSDAVWNLGSQKSLFEHNQWMLEAIRTFPGNKESGLADIPKDLADTVANSDQKRKVADWIDKYGAKTGEFLKTLMVNIHTDGVLIYGIRDKVNLDDKSPMRADPPKSPEGNDYNRISYDFQVTKIIGEDGKPAYKVTQYTDCAQSSWYNLWDIHPTGIFDSRAGQVDSKRGESTHVYKEDDLVPFTSGGEIFFVEPARLADLHWREQNNLVAGKSLEVGLDAIFTVMPLARGAKLATGVIAKQGFKGLIKAAVAKELVAHGAMSCLALAGGLNNAAVRQTPYGPTALLARHATFFTLVGRDLAKKMSSEALTSLELGEAAATEATIGDTTILLGKSTKAGELASSGGQAGRAIDVAGIGTSTRPVASLSTAELEAGSAVRTGDALARAEGIAETGETLVPATKVSEHLPAVSIGSKRAEALYKQLEKLEKRIDKFDAVVQVAMFLHLGKESSNLTIGKMLGPERTKEDPKVIVKEGRKIFERLADDLLINSAQKTLTEQASPELIDRVNKFFAEAKKETIPDDPKVKGEIYLKLTDGLEAKTPQERTAAAISLLNLKDKLELSDLTEQVVLQRLRTDLIAAQANSNGKESLSPQASLLVAQTLLAHDNITPQQYALEVSRVANLTTASPETKMQAIANIGIAAWAAELAEKDHAGDMGYWSTNHGCSRRDLEKQLQQISSGANGETNPDVKAFATATLYSFRHNHDDMRLSRTNESIELWRQNFNTTHPGAYAEAFAKSMRAESTLEVSNKTMGAEREVLRARQYLANVALTELGGVEAKTGLNALARQIDPNAAEATVRALYYLAPKMQSLEPKERDLVIDRTIQFLRKPNNGSPTNVATSLDAAKAQVLKVIPELLSNASSVDQFNRSINSISKIFDRTAGNSWFSNNADLRALAVKAIGDANANQASAQLSALLKYSPDHSPIESSPYARLAALQALRGWNAPGLDALATKVIANEQDPRVKQEAQDILDRKVDSLNVGDGKKPDYESNYAEAEKFLRTNFPYMFKDNFDREMKRLTPEYSSIPVKREYDMFKYPEEVFDREREDWVKRQFKDVVLLGRWAGGKFNSGENVSENGKPKIIDSDTDLAKKVQISAINSFALFVAHNGLTADRNQPLLPDPGRRETVMYSARILSREALTATDPEIRELASRHIRNLIRDKDVNPEAKLELLQGFRGSSIGTDTATQSREEAATRTIEALQNHLDGRWRVEQIPKNLLSESQKLYKESAWSCHLQIALMKDITYRYQDRERGLPLLERIAADTKADRVRVQAQECILALKGGVGLSYRNALAHPDTTTPLARRTALLFDALNSNVVDLNKNIDTIFQYAGGKLLRDPKDSRLPVLLQGLNHDNHTLQLASALSLVNNSAPGVFSHLAMRKLSYMATNDSDPAIRQEAQLKLEDIRKSTAKKQRDNEWYSSRPRGTTEQERQSYKANTEQKAQQYASYLKELAALREQADKSGEGVSFLLDTAFTYATAVNNPLSPKESLTELETKFSGKDGVSVSETEKVEQILLIGARTAFSGDGKDAASKKFKEMLAEGNDRTAMAAAAVLSARSSNIPDFCQAVEKLAQLEATATSDTLKKEAAVLLDRSLSSLSAQAATNPRARSLIALIENERARASGIPVRLDF